MKPRIGSLCSGYGGLDLAVMDVLGGSVAWHCQYDPEDKHQYAARILEHHWPDVPNHGDVTAIDWSSVEQVDVLTAGFPCQDLSHAGRGAGIKEGTRSGLWYAVARAIGALRPRLVVLENVRAIVTQRPGLDVVLASLAEVGFDAEWTCLRASDLGAPHQRERWFLHARPADTDSGDLGGDWARRATDEHSRPLVANASGMGWGPGAGLCQGEPQGVRGRRPGDNLSPTSADAAGVGRGERKSKSARVERGPHASIGSGATPADAASERHGNSRQTGKRRLPATPLPGSLASTTGTPRRGDTARDGRFPPTAGVVLDSCIDGVEIDDVDAIGVGGIGDGVGVRCPIAGHQFDAEPGESAPHLGFDQCSGNAVDVSSSHESGEVVRHAADPLCRPSGKQEPAENGSGQVDWGPFAAAIERWGCVTGRPAPKPTDDRGRLAPQFVEWMMGLPEGHVCDVPAPPGMTLAGLRNARLKALGNGVVPQQAAHALRILLDRARGEVAA